MIWAGCTAAGPDWRVLNVDYWWTEKKVVPSSCSVKCSLIRTERSHVSGSLRPLWTSDPTGSPNHHHHDHHHTRTRTHALSLSLSLSLSPSLRHLLIIANGHGRIYLDNSGAFNMKTWRVDYIFQLYRFWNAEIILLHVVNVCITAAGG